MNIKQKCLLKKALGFREDPPQLTVIIATFDSYRIIQKNLKQENVPKEPLRLSETLGISVEVYGHETEAEARYEELKRLPQESPCLFCI